MVPILDHRWGIFAKVAEHGSLSRAADTLNSPPSVISRHINQLERVCGQRLFRRTGRGVVLTDFGKEVYLRIVPLVAQAEKVSDDILTANGVPIGDVRVGLLPSTVPGHAERLIRAAREQYPKVRLHLTEGASSQLEEWLRSGRLDLALLLREGQDECGGDEPVLLTLALDLVGPCTDPIFSRTTIDFPSLDGLPLVLPPEPHVLRKRLDALAKEHGIRLNVAAEAGTLQLQKEVTASGGGYAIIASAPEPSGINRRLARARIVQPELIRRIVLGASPLRPGTLATRSIARLVISLFTKESMAVAGH